MHIGFTGTRQKLSNEQIWRFQDEFDQLDYYARLASTGKRKIIFHHGDCIGADAFAHVLAMQHGWQIIIHPPENTSQRAYCSGGQTMQILSPLPYMKRNQAIVDACDLLVAVPFEHEEQQRGGTWSTYRKAVKAYKPRIIIGPISTRREFGTT